MTNKLLSYSWDFLSYKEKLYFNNDEKLFLEKKRTLIEIAEISKKMRTLHEKLKVMNEGNEMQSIAELLVDLDYKRTNLFIELDNF